MLEYTFIDACYCTVLGALHITPVVFLQESWENVLKLLYIVLIPCESTCIFLKNVIFVFYDSSIGKFGKKYHTVFKFT